MAATDDNAVVVAVAVAVAADEIVVMDIAVKDIAVVAAEADPDTKSRGYLNYCYFL